MRRFLIAFLVVLVGATLLNFLIHGVLLQPSYQHTPQLLREPADANAHAIFLLLGFFFFALGFVWIYSRGVEAKPWAGQGIRYGVAVWLIASVSRYFIYYAIQPWSIEVVWMQIAYELMMSIVLGLTVAVIYRNAALPGGTAK